MPRLSNDDMGAVLTDLVRAAGGEISHAELVKQLKDRGERQVLARLPALIRTGYIKRELRSQENARPMVFYTAPAVSAAGE